MHLLVIGNGFDLAHGFPTRYTDFLRYCNEYNEKEPISGSDDMNQEFLDFLKNNIWLKYFTKLKELNQKTTWIDFEKEIANIINSLEEEGIEIAGVENTFDNKVYIIEAEKNYDRLKQFISEFTTIEKVKIYGNVNELQKSAPDNKKKRVLKEKQITNVSSFIDFIYQELRNFARAFEIYCLYINSIEVKNFGNNSKNEYEKILNHKALFHIDHILSFNYTNTYERLYKKDNVKYCYIHGKAQEDKTKTNIIFGIDDNLKDGNENEKFEYVKFKKYYQRIVLKTGSEYKDWLIKAADPNEKISDVYIVGHSLDKTDYDILYEIFECKNIRVTVYYYNQSDLDEKVQRVIRLLSYKGKNGRDELIERVHGSNWKIRFVNQYDKNDGIFKN